jgi:polyisoprenoid-binding protein YceI
MQKSLAVLICVIGLTMWACTDPAANKPQATVTNAAPETNTARSAAAETLPVTPENSKVEFIGAKVTGSHNGSFKQFSGTIDLVDNKPETSRVMIDIETASVVTDTDGLTAHLKTPDFFDVAKYPKANFTSTKIEPNAAAGATHTMTGNLDLHGVKKSISFPANIQVAPEKVSVNAEFALNRKDFGIAYAGKTDDLIRDQVAMKLTLNVPRKK